MYNVFCRHALFVQGQSFSVNTSRLTQGRQAIGEGPGNGFPGPSLQALPLPSPVTFSYPLLPSAYYAG